MSEEKAEALRQISEIKNHLIDKQTFFPYNYNATYVWCVIALILTFIMVPMYEVSVLQGTVVMLVLITVGFVTEGVMTKKVNKSYDIEDCTRRQEFIMKNFFMLSLFLIIISTILASYKLYVPIFLSWLFLVSFGYFAVGFVLNIERFSQMAKFNMFAAILLLGLGFANDTLVGSDLTYLSVVQIFIIIGLVILPAQAAWFQKREGK